jgi:hypothetical protein
MKLYEIAIEYETVLDLLYKEAEANEGEVGEELSAKLDAIQMSFEEKVKNVAAAYKNFFSEAEAIKNERERLEKREKSLYNKASWLKEYLTSCISPNKKYSFSMATISWRPSTSVEIVDIEKVPLAFVKTEIKKIPDKKAIKEFAKNSDISDFAKIVQKNNIQIR